MITNVNMVENNEVYRKNWWNEN